MAADCSSMTVADVLRDTWVGAYASRSRALGRSCSGVFLNMPELKMALFRHATEFEHFRRPCEMFRTGFSSEHKVVNFYGYYFLFWFSLHLLICVVDT